MGRIYDIVVRVIRRRSRPATPLPPKRQLPIAEYVYCYDPLDDDGTAGAGWHWEPRKPYFDRSAEAILEYDAPMSSSTSINKPVNSRPQTPTSTAPELSRAPRSLSSGSMSPSTGVPALYSGEFEFAQDTSVQEHGMQSQLASALPSDPDNRADNEIKAKSASPALNSLTLAPPLGNGRAVSVYAMDSAASDYSSGHDSPPRAGPSRIPARPRTTQRPKSILKKPKSPAPTFHSDSSTSPGRRSTPFIPPIIPSPPPIIPSPLSPTAGVFIPFIPPLPSPPPASPRGRRATSPEIQYTRAHASHRLRTSPVIPPHPRAWSPSAHPVVHPPLLRFPRHKCVRDFPAGYYGGVSHLLSPGELVFSFRHPHALHRRLLDGANRVPVPPNDVELRATAFYPAVNHALLLVPQLPWAIDLRANSEPMITVGHVLGGLVEHLSQRLSRAEREMVRERERGRGDLRAIRLRGEVMGVENSWLLGVWEDADAVRHITRARTGDEENEIAQGRRCFVVVFGSEEEARMLSGD